MMAVHILLSAGGVDLMKSVPTSKQLVVGILFGTNAKHYENKKKCFVNDPRAIGRYRSKKVL